MKKFLVGVGNVSAYNPSTGDLLFTSKTMLDDTITTSTSAQEVRGGQGNQLLYKFYHTGKMNVTLTETQFNLAMIASAVGSTITTGKNIWTEEEITLGVGGTGIVTNTPLISPDSSTIYGWVTDKNDITTKVTFTGKNFTLAGGSSSDLVTVRYYNNNANVQSVEIPANIIPSVIRLVIDAQEGSDSVGSGIIGNLQIEIPRVSLDGSTNFAMKSSGVSNTPLKGEALSYKDSNRTYYATVTEIIDNAHWYDNVFALASTSDPVTVNTATPTFQLDLRAIPTIGSAFKPPFADLTFTSSDSAKATISAGGLITKVATGTCIVTVSITGKTSITTNIDVTVA